MATSPESFEAQTGVKLLNRLGFGKDGDVWYSSRSTAVKLFARAEEYHRERNAYVQLRDTQIDYVAGHAVPNLHGFDDNMLWIEMTIVEPPFLLDFASAYPEDETPDFPQDVWDQWMFDKAEEFGDRWFDVLRVRAEFQKVTGLVLMDVNPGNIKFE